MKNVYKITKKKKILFSLLREIKFLTLINHQIFLKKINSFNTIQIRKINYKKDHGINLTHLLQLMIMVINKPRQKKFLPSQMEKFIFRKLKIIMVRLNKSNVKLIVKNT